VTYDGGRSASELWTRLGPRDARPLAQQLDEQLVVEEAERVLRYPVV
jgi:hypothetical protein